jgi:hypothetical protein
MPSINPADIWTLARKKSGGMYVRSKHNIITSEKVKAAQSAFARKATGCKGKDRMAFRECMRK